MTQPQSTKSSLPGLYKKQSRKWSVVLFSTLAIALFFSVVFFTGSETEYISHPLQLEDFDFSSRIAVLSPEIFERYAGALYSPDDFFYGLTSSPVDHETAHSNFSTYRLLINLEEGIVYGLTGYSAYYAMYLWIDGTLRLTVGSPGDSLDNMTMGAKYFTEYFASGQDATEIIIWRSCFVDANGGQLNHLFMAEQSLIDTMNSRQYVRVSIIIGVTIMAALIFLGVFLFFNDRRHFLWFAITCLVIAFRTFIIDHKIIIMLFPDISSYLVLRLEYLCTSGFTAASFLFINSIFKNQINRILKICTLGYIASYTLVILVAHSTIYTLFRNFSLVWILICALVLIFNLGWLIKKNNDFFRPEYFMVSFAHAITTVLGIAEVFLRFTDIRFANINLMYISTLIFVLINTVALALNFRRTEEELVLANEQRQKHEAEEQRLQSDNAALDNLNRMKAQFLGNMSHEIKTPLAVILGDIQRIAWVLEKHSFENEGVSQSISRSQNEVNRIARLTERAIKMSSLQEVSEKMKPLDTGLLFTTSIEAYRSLIEKQGNVLIVSIDEDLPQILGNTDELIGVMSNLLTNANKHTKNGNISVEIKSDDEWIYAAVTDTGTGIPPELLPQIFERGVSGSDSTGMGLAISKQTIETHGGTITIESVLGKGTRATFKILAYSEENNREGLVDDDV